MIHTFRLHKFVLLAVLLMILSPAWAAYLTDIPVTVRQPNGVELHCFASGDEYHNWLHDKDNYTIIQSPTNGYYMYAIQSGTSIEAGSIIAGRGNPSRGGLLPFVNISEEEYRVKRNTMFQIPNQRNAPTSGTINNLVVFIRFSGETEFGEYISTYEGWFNTNTSSQKSYFQEASYNQLTVNTTLYPAPAGGYVVSWQDSHPRGYYQPYSATSNPIGYTGGNSGTERATREFTLLENATNAVSAAIPSDLVIDADGDGNVDNVVYIISGSSGGWSSLLWPHRWAIYDRTVLINGKRVYDFNLQLKNTLTTKNVGVLCHEFFHTLGAPDLYHYTSNGINPAGSWDLMEANTNPPQHMGAFMKYKYGHWISDIPTKSAIQSYTLNPMTSPTGNAIRINSPNSATEYFIVEYRRKTGTFENSLPGSGLLVYRINSAIGGGNAAGPPDELYIYRPGGTTTANGTYTTAMYCLNVGRTAMNETTDPTPFLSDGSPGGLILSGIGATGTTISFNIGNPIPGNPLCEIISPSFGSVYNLGELIGIDVTASDPAKSIVHVDFYLDGGSTPSFSDYISPYSWEWNSTGAVGGVHAIRATAVDNLGNSTSNDVSVFLLAPLDEGFETGNLSAFPWQNSGDLPWFIQSVDKYTGTFAARSGMITDSQTSSMIVSLNITEPGYLSFEHKVSSEAGWDVLKLYIDNVMMGSWSGAGVWTMQYYPLLTGLHEFKWSYTKDTNSASGSDCAYVDHIVFPPYFDANPPVNLNFQINTLDFELHWDAVMGATSYLIYEADTPGGSWTLKDTTLTNVYVQPLLNLSASHFYKVIAVYQP